MGFLSSSLGVLRFYNLSRVLTHARTVSLRQEIGVAELPARLLFPWGLVSIS